MIRNRSSNPRAGEIWHFKETIAHQSNDETTDQTPADHINRELSEEALGEKFRSYWTGSVRRVYTLQFRGADIKEQIEFWRRNQCRGMLCERSSVKKLSVDKIHSVTRTIKRGTTILEPRKLFVVSSSESITCYFIGKVTRNFLR